MKNKTPHRHAEVIKAWADGYQVQVLSIDGEWADVHDPSFNADIYRIKPDDIVRIVTARMSKHPYDLSLSMTHPGSENVRLTFCGETHKLKAVEMITEGQP